MRRLLLATAAVLALLPAPACADADVKCDVIETIDQGSNGTYTSIAAAIAGQPLNFTQNRCLFFLDTVSYNENVIITGFTMNDKRLTIGAITSGARPTVQAPVAIGGAAFTIANASITIIGLNIVPSLAMSHAVSIGGESVVLSSVNIAGGGFISAAAVVLSSGTVIEHSQIFANNAHGLLQYAPSGGAVVRHTTVTVNSIGIPNAVSVVSSERNVFVNSFFANTGTTGHGISFSAGANHNQLIGSTVTAVTGIAGYHTIASSGNSIASSYVQGAGGNATNINDSDFMTITGSTFIGTSGRALQFADSDSCTVTGAYIRSNANNGLAFASLSHHNVVSLSTITSFSAATPALVFESGSGSNTVSGSYVQNFGGTSGATFSGGTGSNLIQLSTIVANSMTGYGVQFNNGLANRMNNSFVRNIGGVAVRMDSFGSFHSIMQSTMIAGGVSAQGLFILNSDSNTITDSYIETADGHGLHTVSGSDWNTIVYSTMIGKGSDNAGFFLQNSTGTRITDSVAYNATGRGGVIFTNNYQTFVTRCQVTSGASSASGLFVSGALYTIVTDSLVSGATGFLVMGSTQVGTYGSTLEGTSGMGMLVGGSQDLILSTSVFKAEPAFTALTLSTGNTGDIQVSSSTFEGAGRGMDIDAPGAGLAISVSSVSFNSLAVGSTGIRYLGGVHVTTFTEVEFNGSDLLTNVDATALGVPSRITMKSAFGDKAGPASENDPSGVVDWTGSYPGCAEVLNVGVDWPFASVQGAVNSLPNPFTGHTCIIIEDSVTYFEQVTIDGIKTNGSSLTIRSRNDVAPRATIQPPGGQTAAFIVRSASVNIAALDINVIGAIQYGIYASSGWLNISSVAINSGGGGISSAGIQVSSWTSVSDSTVSVMTAGAMVLPAGADYVTVRDVALGNSYNSADTLDLEGSRYGSFTRVYAENSNGRVLELKSGAEYNSFTRSTFTTSSPAQDTVLVSGSSSNTFSHSFINSFNLNAILFSGGSQFNLLAESTITTSGGVGVFFQLASSNTVSGVNITAGNGRAIAFGAGAQSNSVARATATSTNFSVPTIEFANSASSNVLVQVNASNNNGAVAKFLSNAHHNRVELSSFNAMGAEAILIEASTANAITTTYAVSQSSHAVRLSVGADYNTLDRSTFSADSGAAQRGALYLEGASSNTVTNVLAVSRMGWAAYLYGGANQNTLSRSSFTSAISGSPSVFFGLVSSNTLDASYVYSGFFQAISVSYSDNIYVAWSTAVSASGGSPAIHAAFSSSVTVADVMARNTTGPALQVSDLRHSAFARSTFTSGGYAFSMNNSSWNTLTDIYAHASGIMPALYLQNGSNFNQISGSTFSATAGSSYAADFMMSSSNTVTGSRFVTTSVTAWRIGNQSHWNTVQTSSITSFTTMPTYEALRIDSSTGTRVMNSYIQGSTAVTLSGQSWGTFLNGNRLAGSVGFSGSGCALRSFDSGNVTLTSNTITSNGDGVCLDSGGGFSRGALLVASNTISARYNGMRVQSQSTYTEVWISSNAIHPQLGVWPSRGMLIENLTTGATVYGNSIYFRASGGAAGVFQRAIETVAAQGLLFARNRINIPGSVTLGNIDVLFFNTSILGFYHNDVHVQVPATVSSVRVLSIVSGTLDIKNNIFSSDVPLAVASATYYLNGHTGFRSNYNVLHSVNAAPYFYSDPAPNVYNSGIASWSAQRGQDVNSTSGNPYWVSTVAGAEDFHVKSTAGRCTDAPTCDTFVNDAVDSSSLDAADPAAPYAAEPMPNGYQANAGYTGNTIEASKSPAQPCAVFRTVCKTGGCGYASIQQAVNSIPNPLVGHSCVSIRDNSWYDETVTVASFTLAGSSITIAVDPAFSTGAVLRPNAAIDSAILDIRTASTTVSGLTIRTGATTFDYGVRVTSPNVTLSSVSVFDESSRIDTAGILLSTESYLSYSTISVMNPDAAALISSGSWVRISHASMSWASGGAATKPIMSFSAGYSSATLTDIVVNAYGDAVAASFGAGTNNTVARATFSTTGGPVALQITTATAMTLSDVVIANRGPNNPALLIDSNSRLVVIDRSSVSASAMAAFPGAQVKGSSHVLSNLAGFFGGSGHGLEISGTGIRVSSPVIASSAGPALLIVDSTGTVVERASLYSPNGHALRVYRGRDNSVDRSTMTTRTTSPSVYAAHLHNTSSVTISGSLVENLGTDGYALYLQDSGTSTIVNSTVTTSGVNGPALYLQGASSNTLSGLRILSYFYSGVFFDAFSTQNTLDRSTVTAMGLSGAGIAFNGASSNTVSNSMVVSTNNYGMYISMGSQLITVQGSTVIGHGDAEAGVYVNGASSHTFADSYFAGPSGYGIQLNDTSANQVLRSTVVSGVVGYPALDLSQSYGNFFDQSVFISTGNESAVRLRGASGSNSNLFTRSSMTATRGLMDSLAYEVEAGSANVVESSFLSGTEGARLLTANNRISFSTITATSLGAYLTGVGHELSHNYIRASTAATLFSTQYPLIYSNRLVATGSGASGIEVASTGDLRFTSNTVTGPALGAGLAFGTNNSGYTDVSTNTFLAGPAAQIKVGEFNLGSSLWITSNTIVPTVSPSTTSYGILIESLSKGATVQNNDIFYRGTGVGMGAFVTYGLLVRDSTGIKVDHNRYSQPGVITGGGAGGSTGFYFANTITDFQFNDVYSKGTANTAPHQLRLVNTANSVVRNNIFVNDISPSGGESVAIHTDATSAAGLVSDYNDIHLIDISALAGRVFGANRTFEEWQSLGYDANSISLDPVWTSTATEDFHPRSAATNGRYNPASGLFDQQDLSSSPTIDAGDPAAPVLNETFPGTSRVNQGSYGQTVQASRAAPPPGCEFEYTVPSLSYPNVAAALAAADDSALNRNECIVIRQATLSAGVITVPATLNTNGYRLTIMGEPGITPVYEAASASDAFVINSASVTIKNLLIRPTGNITNTIRSAYSDVIITSVTIDGAAVVQGTAISVSTRSVVSYSSVSARGTAIRLLGTGASVSNTWVEVITANGVGLRVQSATNAMVTDSYFTSSLSSAGVVLGGSTGTVVMNSSFTSTASRAFVVSAASGTRVSSSVFSAPGGSALVFASGAYGNEVAFSSASSAANGVPTVLFDAASSNTVTRTYLDHSGAGQTAMLQAGANFNTLSQGYIDGHSNQAVVYAQASSTFTLSEMSLYNASGPGVRLESGSQYARVLRSTIAVTVVSDNALRADASIGLTITESYLANDAGLGRALYLSNGANRATVDLSTLTTGAGHTLEVASSSYTRLTRSLFEHRGGGYSALRLSDSHAAFVDESTMTAVGGNAAIDVVNGRDNVFHRSHIVGGKGLYANSATRTTVSSSHLQATSSSESALQVLGAGTGLTVTSNTMVALVSGKGASVESGVLGAVVIASNTFLSGPHRAVSVAFNSANVFIASNTVIPAVWTAAESAGIWLENLTNGATVQNNSVYFRASETGVFSTYGLYAQSVPGLVIERNRISNPGMVTAGAYMGVYLSGSPRARFKNNDIYSATAQGFPLISAYGLSVLTSDTITIKNNIFSSSLTVTGSSATFIIDGASTSGSDSDYNIHFSSKTRNTMIDSTGAREYPLVGDNIDENSLVLNPHWPSVVPGAEDFHPRSQAGRYDPTLPVPDFVNDSWTSGSLDRGDYDDLVGNETAPNGDRINMGSYGGTAEASRTPAGPTAAALGSVQVSSISVTFVMSSADRYSVTASSTDNFSSFITSMSAGNSANALAPQGLTPNTTYFLVAAAHWGDAYVDSGVTLSTPTLAAAPGAPGAVPFPQVYRTSMTATWTTATNPLSMTTYTVTFAASTGDVIRTTVPSVTAAARETVGLTPNTTYTVSVIAVNHAGIPTSATVIGSTATRANEPLTAATTFFGVLDQSLSVRWDNNANPLSITSYTIQASVASDFNIGASSVSLTTAPAFGPAATLAGLIPATTYYFRVRAHNGDGEPTPYVVLGSTVMLPLQIQAPAVQPVSTSTVDSLTATWGLVSNATGYTLYASTEGQNPPLSVWASSTVFGQANTTATVFSPALDPNTTYYLFVRANGLNGNSVYTAYVPTTTVTATPAPGVPPFGAVHFTSATVIWQRAGNPIARTTYTVVMSTSASLVLTDAGNVSVSTLPGAFPSIQLTSLTPNTTYTAFVAAISHAGSSTAFVSLGSTATRAALPVALAVSSANVLDLAFDVLWGAGGNPLGITSYTVMASVDSGFSVLASSVVLTTSPASGPGARLSGLVPATTYYLQVRALNGDGEATPYVGLGAAITLPLQIQAPAVQPVTASSTYSITAAWGLSSNATGYTLYASTEGQNPPVTVWASSTTFGQANTTATVFSPALDPNTTYYLFVRAHGFNGNSIYTAYIPTATVTATPTPATPTFAPVHQTSATVSWLRGGNPIARTTYTVVMSTSVSLVLTDAGNVSVSTLAGGFFPNLELPGLTPNTTYTAFVAAISHAGSSTAFVSLGSTATRAALPVALAVSSANVTDLSFDVLWGAGGNPLGITSYTVVASVDSGFSVLASSVVLTTAPASGPGARLSGFTPATTYYLQVRALNGDGEATPYVGLGAAVTLPLQIQTPGVQPVTSASTYSITAAWGLISNATGYTLYASTESLNPPVTVWASSSTFSQAATTATVFTPALQPNTTYFLFVRAHGFTSNSLYAVFPATATLPAAPLTAVTTFSAVGVTSFTVSWLSGGNPLAMTTYTVVASTAANFNAGASAVTLSTVPAGGPSATLAGLSAYTTWYVRVRALGQGDTVTPFVTLGSTQTLPIELAEPLVNATGVSASSVTASWSLVAGATGYTLAASYSSVNPPVSVVASSIVAAGDTSASLFGLTPNTTHHLFIRANGPGNSGLYSVYPATATNPDFPTAVAPPFTAVAAASMTVSWLGGANPPGITTYTVTLSTTPTFPNVSGGNSVSTTAALALNMGSLQPNTTYTAFVEALSHGGARFGTVLGSTATLANPPLPGSVVSVGVTSATLSWPANGNPLGTIYIIVASTESNFNAFASSVVYTTAPAAGPMAVATGLAFGTTWHFRVQAVSHNGSTTAFVTLGSTYTNLSNLIPLAIDLQSGDDVWRRANSGLYNMSFVDASSTHLDRVEVSVSTTPGGFGTDLVPFTVAFGNLSPSDAYADPFSLPNGVFDAMLEGVTNYVTVRVYNHVPATNTVVDAFYVRKDTTAPAFTNNEAGGDSAVQTAAGRVYSLTARDATSGLAAFQYSVSLTPGAADAALVPWTDIPVAYGATDYTTPWSVAFASLQSGATNYVSVRAWDVAGATTPLTDAFRVLKDTTGPTVSISTPAAGTGFVSVVAGAAGGAAGAFGVQGVEVAVRDEGANRYWNGSTSYNAVNPVWMAATGSSSWTATLAGIPFNNSVAYKIVARSSTTYGLFSTTYATAAFTVDTATPTVGVTTPAPLSTVSSLPLIAGTAADAGAAPSGVVTIETRLQRLSDGLWWNWSTEAWSALEVSSVSAGGATWNVTPSAVLQGNLRSGTSYFIAVRATDLALPANAGDFFTQGSTFTFNDPTPPAAVNDLVAVNGPLPGDIYLTWTAQGPHGSTGFTTLGQYAIFGSTDNLAVPSTSAATTIVFATASVSAGAFQGYVASGLSPGVTYFIYVAMANADGNWSAFSSPAVSTTATPSPSDAILGHVVNASTQGITAVRIDAFDSTGLLVATAFTLADGSGTYSVNGLSPGNYKIEASWTANGITSSVWIDAIPMGSVNIDFSLDINYALATLTGTLGALSSGPAGLGVAGSGYRPSAAGSHVELYQGGREVSRAGVGPTGRWTIGHLLPGTYSVRAYTGLTYTDFQEVQLAEGEIRTVGFVFNPLPEASVFAFPNPARTATTIRFETALQPIEAQIAIFDLKGGLVREVPGSQIVATATPGVYHYAWDLTNSRGQAVASGVYLFMVKVKGGSENQLVKVIKKVAVVR